MNRPGPPDLPPLGPPEAPLRVAVFTCGRLGFEAALRIREEAGVDEVAVFFTPYRARRKSVRKRLRHVLRTQGAAGVARVFLFKLAAPFRKRSPGGSDPLPGGWPDEIPVFFFDDFHQAECLDRLMRNRPDLGVVAGTYILRPELLAIPRLGCINLHSGRVPEYRGAAPAFWELYNGETSVGITIHRVTARVDRGPVLKQELFPVDPAPPEDPMEYIERLREEVLRPNGIRMLAETVREVAAGIAVERPQEGAAGKTYRTPGRSDVKELRRRVEERRRCRGG